MGVAHDYRLFNWIDRVNVDVDTEIVELRPGGVTVPLTDRARYPVDLQELVKEHYLRQVPVDPITERADAWVLVPAADAAASGVRDVHSGAPGLAKNGTAYASW